MKQNEKALHRKRHRTRSILLVVIFVLVSLFLSVNIYYRAGDEAQAVMARHGIQGNAGDVVALEAEGSPIGLILYPGAKVEFTAYLPLCERLSEANINVFLVRMPYNFAFLGKNRADSIISAHPEIEHWYMGGHSLGGAMASAYASEHEENIEGVVLLGAYLYGSFPAERSITIFGSEDRVLNRKKITYAENIHELLGGNHAQFGDYGSQRGDGHATITPEEQWKITTDLIVTFVRELGAG